MNWPAFAYLYGTWGYALTNARDHASERRQKVYLYRAEMNGRWWWVASWGPEGPEVVMCPVTQTTRTGTWVCVAPAHVAASGRVRPGPSGVARADRHVFVKATDTICGEDQDRTV